MTTANGTQQTATQQTAASGATEKPAVANGKAMARVAPIEQLKKSFEQWKPTLRAILPKHIDPERVIKIACNVYMNKPELQLCTPLSMVKATLQCAELGLDPSPLLQECAFIPFDNKKKVKDGNQWVERVVREVQLMPQFVGLIKLAKQSGEVSDVYAVAVDESERTPEFDESGKLVAGFYVEQGTVRRIQHIPKMDGQTGNLFAVYGVVKFKDGTHHFEVLSKGQVDRYRTFSKTGATGPWKDHFEAMAKKTVIKQALKTVPKSAEKPKLAMALAADNSVEMGEAFSTEVTDAIDTDGVEVHELAPAQAPSRTDAMAAKLAGADPETGEVK